MPCSSSHLTCPLGHAELLPDVTRTPSDHSDLHRRTMAVFRSTICAMPANHTDLEKRLWDAADELRANSKLKSSEYSIPVLGLIFLRYADHKFAEAEKKLSQQGSGRRKIGKTDYQAQGVLYLPEKARFATLLNLPEGTDIGKAINEAMKAIEAENEDLKDVLPEDVQPVSTKNFWSRC